MYMEYWTPVASSHEGSMGCK